MRFHLSTEAPTEVPTGPSDAADPRWDAFVARSPWNHLLQSSPWGRFKSEFGWRVLRLTGESGGEIACGAQALIRPTPGGPAVYVPRGPVIDPDDDALPGLLAALAEAAAERGAVFLKLEPEWPEAAATADRLTQLGFQPSDQVIQPRSTIALDLQADAGDLLMEMKSKWRYNIRLAGRKDVRVTRATPEDLPAFYDLMAATGDRSDFGVHERGYYEAAWRTFHPLGLCELLLARFDDELLGGLMVFRFGGTAYYLYGASSSRHRDRMPNHLLQWEAIRWAKEQGCNYYDFWGIPDEVGAALAHGEEPPERSDGMWGVYRFKRGFGGRVVRTVGSFDRVFKAGRYWLGTRAWPWLRRLNVAGDD
jgi:peptidoglycan pentaglycine glycine transferase (the first glycine)